MQNESSPSLAKQQVSFLKYYCLASFTTVTWLITKTDDTIRNMNNRNKFECIQYSERSEVYKFVASADCTARQKLNCECFYRSLGCPQLLSSSFDVRVYYQGCQVTLLQVRMQMQCTVMFYSKCISLRLFTVKTLLFSKICTFKFMLHRVRGIPFMNWFFSPPNDVTD